MSDRIRALTIILDDDYSNEAVQPLINAISQIKGVLKVEKEITSSLEYSTAYERAKTELANKLWKVLYKEQDE